MYVTTTRRSIVDVQYYTCSLLIYACSKLLNVNLLLKEKEKPRMTCNFLLLIN